MDDSVSYLKFIIALAFVLSLIGITAWVWKRFGTKGFSAASFRTKQRLQLKESLMLEGRYRLAIVQCDGQEHVLLLGPDKAQTLDALTLPNAMALPEEASISAHVAPARKKGRAK